MHEHGEGSEGPIREEKETVGKERRLWEERVRKSLKNHWLKFLFF